MTMTKFGISRIRDMKGERDNGRVSEFSRVLKLKQVNTCDDDLGLFAHVTSQILPLPITKTVK
jgi:hypothetical protein